MEKRKRIKWTKEELRYLRDNYKNMFYSDIADYLNRTLKSVNLKAFRLKLNPGPRGRPRNQKEDKNGNWKGGISKDNYHYKKIQIERYPKKIRLG